MTIKKAMEIFREKDPEKRSAMIDALSDEEKEVYRKEAENLAKEGDKLRGAI